MSAEIPVNDAHDAQSSNITLSCFITLDDGATLYCHRAGDGHKQTMLFLNPFLGTGAEDFAPFLSIMSNEYNCVSIDMRGQGFSKHENRVSDGRDYHRDASDAWEIMKKLGYTKYSIYGNSDGATIGVILAAQHSECVEHLFLYGTTCYINDTDMALSAVFRDVTNWGTAWLNLRLKHYSREELQDKMNKNYEMLEKLMEKHNGEICVSEAKRVTCPTLIIQPERDPIHGKEHVDFIKDNIRGSTMHVLPGVDVMTMATIPREIIALMKDFMAKH